jgi:hypothetical protein
MNKLTQNLIQAFQIIEEEIQHHLPKIKPTIRIWINRSGQELKLEYTVMQLGGYPDDQVTGKVLNDVVDEYLRRKGFDQRQKEILLEGPSLETESYEVEPVPPLDDEIPF